MENNTMFVYGTTRKMYLLQRPSRILHEKNTIDFFYNVFRKNILTQPEKIILPFSFVAI
jgi:hypothetical protein